MRSQCDPTPSLADTTRWAPTNGRSPRFAADFDPGGTQRVSGVCPANTQASDAVQASDTIIDAQASELGVQVSLPAGEMGGEKSLDVTYDLGGTKRTAVIPFGIWLCARTCPDNLGS